PAAQASENPIVYTKYSPRRSPAPRLRPGASGLIAAPNPRPGEAGQAALDGGKTDWAVQLGVFAREETAIAELASAALGDIDGLDNAGRRIDEMRLSGRTAYRARLTGFDRPAALAACVALRDHGRECEPVSGGER
ncbi:MAG: hypothetical protein ACK5MQ_09785, partial [Pikeienuella sp.]